MTPSRPVNRGMRMTRYLDSLTMTIKGRLQVSIAIVKAFFSRLFFFQNLAGSRDM